MALGIWVAAVVLSWASLCVYLWIRPFRRGDDDLTGRFGDVAFHGSLGANPPPAPVVAVALKR